MSKIEQIVCDRCGKPFEYRLSNVAGYFRKGIKVRNFFHFRKLFYGNPSGYEYGDHAFELCADCTNKLDEFLKGNMEMTEEINERLINEYISKVNCCDECFASIYCTVNRLRKSRVPQDYCVENIKRYFGDRERGKEE